MSDRGKMANTLDFFEAIWSGRGNRFITLIDPVLEVGSPDRVQAIKLRRDWRPHLATMVRECDGAFNLHFAPALFKGSSRKKRDIVQLRVCWVDCDTPESVRSLERFPIKPSYIIRTSPERCQAFWILEDHAEWQEVERLNRALAKSFGADSAWSAEHLLRLPFTFNVKRALDRNGHPREDRFLYPGRSGSPFRTTLEGNGRLVSPSQLRMVVSSQQHPGPSQPPRVLSVDVLLRLLPEGLRRAAEGFDPGNQPIPKGERSEHFWRVIAHLADRGYERNAVELLAHYANQHLMENDYSDAQVAAQVEKVLEKAAAGGGRGLHVSKPWPVIGDEAFAGLVGNVIRDISPHTEADPVGLLIDFLVAFGNALGPGPHMLADGAPHPPRLHAVLVGRTSRARKGTARWNIKRLFDGADPMWSQHQVMGGLSTGEGLIATLEDEDEIDDLSVSKDKRLLIVETEFARLLTVAARDGNTLSTIIRQAWDSGDLRVMTKKNPLKASGAHISMIAHITEEELINRLTEVEMANGFANRILLAMVKRSKLLPMGGSLTDEAIAEMGERIRQTLVQARQIGRMHRSAEAEDLWDAIYREIDRTEPTGMLGAMTARAEAQILRLSVAYAAVDVSPVIERRHIESANAVWQYCERTIDYVFGDAIGDEVADHIYAALVERGELGRSAIGNLFARHVSSGRIDRAIELLRRLGRIDVRTEETGGRPKVVVFLR